MKIIRTDNVQEADKDEIFQGLLSYNLERIEDKNPKDFGIYVEENEKKIAGIIGETHGNWMEVDYLWVDEAHRKNHIGSDLLKEAESLAKERGCTNVFLNTFHFQAPEFYKKHGYEEVFVLENYPLTGKRHYYVKNL